MNKTRLTRSAHGRPTRGLVPLLVTVVVAMLLSTLSFAGLGGSADAAGPPYGGPQTESTGPAFFGPAPNPFPYCENPTYFDPFPENVNPMGSIDVTGAPNALVTTNGIDLTFELTAEGDPGGQYPGFFPGGGQGSPGDQPKGLEMASEDAGLIRLSEPLFYTQWIFTDVDQPGEGFNIAPQWSSAPGQVAIFGGDAFWDFTGTTQTSIVLDDGNGAGSPSEAIEGRVQIDLLGAVTGLDVARFPGEGQSGFAIGGGCDPIGVAKELTSGPTWNGSSFDVTYTIRVRNNLPSAATIGADIAAAQAAADAASRSNTSTGTPIGIEMTGLTLTDLLPDSAFSAVTVVSNTTTEGDITANAAFDGDADPAIIEAGQTIAPEGEAAFELVLQYVPEAAGPLGPDCTAVYDLQNQATVGGSADGVDVVDLSDDGTNPDPGADNGSGETDDPTPVQFDCPPEQADPVLEIVKTVVAAGTACPAFADGEQGDGAALSVEPGDTVTYCITVNNPGTVDLTGVAIADAMAPATFDGAVGDLPAGTEQTRSFDLVVEGTTAPLNTASASADGVDPVTDTALIDPVVPGVPVLEIVKTVVAAGTACPAFADGEQGDGAALSVEPGNTVTYCITVNNPGTIDLTDVVISDPMAPATFDGAVGDLPAGTEQTRTFDLVVEGTTAPLNTASATGNDPDGTALDPVEDTALIDPVVPGEPVLEIVKTVVAAGTACPVFADGVDGDGAALSVEPGDTVTYCITVNNPGTVDLTGVVIADAMAPATFDGAVGDLPAGTEQTRSFDLVVEGTTPAQNTASASADGVDPVEDTALIDPAVSAAISLTKTVLAGAGADCAAAVEGEAEFVLGAVGDPITWCFVVTNTGSVALTNVMFDDAPAGIEGRDLLDGAEPPVLLVGDSIRFSLNDVITEDGATNVATVSAEASSLEGVPIPGVPGVEDINEAAVNEAAVELNKTVVAGADAECANASELVTLNAGLEVTYCFTITNTGGVSLRVTEVVDDTLGVTIPVPAAEQDIVPGASVTVTHTALATGDIVNTASIEAHPLDPTTGEPIPGREPLRTDDPAEIRALEANLSIVKTNVGAAVTSAGDRVPYTLLVSNSGPDEAVNVVVVDTLPDGMAYATVPQLDGWTCSAAGLVMTCTKATPLLAGDSALLTYEMSVPIGTDSGRDLVNVASVTSDTPDPDPSDNEDDATVTTVPPVTQFLPSNPALPIPVITNPPPSPLTPAVPLAPPAAPLAVTGVYSSWLAAAAAAMTATGGVFFVSGRRRSNEYR